MKIKQFPVVLSSKKSYIQRIIETNPIVYFPMNETSGTAVVNYGTLGTAANGTYTGVTLNNTAAPGGTKAPYWDGINDTLDFTSAAVNTNWDRAVYTISIWCKVDFPWNSGSYRNAIGLVLNNNNRVYWVRNTGAAEMDFIQNGNSASTKRNLWTGLSYTDWFHTALTVSGNNGQMNTYINGVAFATPVNNVTAIVGNPTCSIGTYTNNGSWWKGWLVHAAIWNRALSASEIQDLYVRGL